MSLLVTGGAGFIGSNFMLDWLAQSDEPLINLDKLTYAGNIENLQSLNGDRRHVFVQGDIGDSALVNGLLAKHQPRAIINFAAESHVDRSIHGPEDFIQTNIVATFHLLEAVRAYWHKLQGDARQNFRFLHVSTDEVYGSQRTTPPSPKPIATNPTARIRRVKPPVIIWCVPTTTPTACRCSPPTAPTTTARITSRKSSSR